MSFFGTAGLSLAQIDKGIQQIQEALTGGEPYGMNFICYHDIPQFELDVVRLYLERGIKRIEASAFMQITPTLVLFRLSGLTRNAAGKIHCGHRIMAKISRPEVAEAFMSPAPERCVAKLLETNQIAEAQAEMGKLVPMAHEICVEADSAGHTDQGIPTVLYPVIRGLADEIGKRFGYEKRLKVGLAGGIGTPAAAAASFTMGADFILTGSINQCTVEAGISDAVKDLLQQINVQDTAYAPAGDMFEMGSKVQVLKKGVFFPHRANKLQALYHQYESLDQIPGNIRSQLETRFFKKTFDEIWRETVEYLEGKGEKDKITRAARNPKHKMALVFRWYFGYSMRLAFEGDLTNRVDFQVHTGPALGAFNQWVAGTHLENWRNRHADEIGITLMEQTAAFLSRRFGELAASNLQIRDGCHASLGDDWLSRRFLDLRYQSRQHLSRSNFPERSDTLSDQITDGTQPVHGT